MIDCMHYIELTVVIFCCFRFNSHSIQRQRQPFHLEGGGVVFAFDDIFCCIDSNAQSIYIFCGKNKRATVKHTNDIVYLNDSEHCSDGPNAFLFVVAWVRA